MSNRRQSFGPRRPPLTSLSDNPLSRVDGQPQKAAKALDLEGKLASSEMKNAMLQRELKLARARTTSLETELDEARATAAARVEALEKDLDEARAAAAAAPAASTRVQRDLKTARARATSLQKDLDKARATAAAELDEARAAAAEELDEARAAAAARIEALEQELDEARATAAARVEALEQDLDEARSTAKAAPAASARAQRELKTARARATSLEKELDKARKTAASRVEALEEELDKARATAAARVEALETELDEARKTAAPARPPTPVRSPAPAAPTPVKDGSPVEMGTPLSGRSNPVSAALEGTLLPSSFEADVVYVPPKRSPARSAADGPPPAPAAFAPIGGAKAKAKAKRRRSARLSIAYGEDSSADEAPPPSPPPVAPTPRRAAPVRAPAPTPEAFAATPAAASPWTKPKGSRARTPPASKRSSAHSFYDDDDFGCVLSWSPGAGRGSNASAPAEAAAAEPEAVEPEAAEPEPEKEVAVAEPEAEAAEPEPEAAVAEPFVVRAVGDPADCRAALAAVADGDDTRAASACAVALAAGLARVGVGAPRAPHDALLPWLRAAADAEAQANDVARANDAGGDRARVRFRRFDFSATAPPSDTRADSQRETELLCERLSRVVAAGDALRPAARADGAVAEAAASLAAALRAVGDGADAGADWRRIAAAGLEPSEVRGAARLWARELEALAPRASASASELAAADSWVRGRVGELASSAVRFHLRRLLNPPPFPGTKCDDPDEAYAWARSGAHRVVRLETVDPDGDAIHRDGALAAQVTASLGDLARAKARTLAGAGRAEPPRRATADKVADLELRLRGACAHRFLHRLLHWPRLDAVLDAAGGWAPVERFAAVAVVHGDDALAATVAPLVDVKATRAKLAAGLGDADAAKRAALGDLRAVARSARLADVQALAQAAAKDAMLYPDVAPPGP